MSTGIRRCLPSRVSSHLDDELALLGGHAGGVGDLGHLAADEVHPFVQQPLVELLVALLVVRMSM